MKPFNVMRTGSAAGGGGAIIPLLAPSHSVADPADASATFQLTNAGVCNSTGETSQNWLLSGAAADYQVRVSPTSGSFSSGNSVNVWHGLGTSRFWTRNRTTIGINTTVATVEIRRVSDSVVVANQSVTWTAEVG